MRRSKSAKSSEIPRQSYFVGWSEPLQGIGVTIFTYLIPGYVIASILAAIFHLRTEQQISDFLNKPLVNLVVYVFVFLCSFFIIRAVLKLSGKKVRDLGFKKPKAFDIVNIFAAYAVYFVILRIVFAVILTVKPSVDLDQVQNTGYNSSAGPELILAFLGLVIIAPIFEEFLFRGYLYKSLRSRLPKIIAALVTSGLFALAHSPWNAQVDVFILSMVLIWLLETTDNLWVSIGLHSLKNLIAFAYVFVIK